MGSTFRTWCYQWAEAASRDAGRRTGQGLISEWAFRSSLPGCRNAQRAGWLFERVCGDATMYEGDETGV